MWAGVWLDGGGPTGDSTMSAATVLDRELEGGGGVSQRPRRKATAAPHALCVVADEPSTTSQQSRGVASVVQTLVASRPELVPPSGPVTELVGLATCPGCHTAHASFTMADVTAGAHWECRCCAARWDARRLATAAAYAVWVAERGIRTLADRGFNDRGGG